jgi:hypothetical protein
MNGAGRGAHGSRKQEGFFKTCGREPVRVLKNEHQAVSQGARRFGKRSMFIDM